MARSKGKLVRAKRSVRTLGAALIAAGILVTGADAAPALRDCGEVAKVTYLVGEGKDAIRTFANGAIRLYYTDTYGEPVCCSSYLVIIAPDPEEELAGAQCKVLHDDANGAGFSAIEFKKIKASYDAARGLLVRVPLQYYDPSGVGDTPGPKQTVLLRINQATGALTFE
ncbi:MAG: hypothetical protein AAFQ42_03410 [Pseudomonadota bacterium]